MTHCGRSLHLPATCKADTCLVAGYARRYALTVSTPYFQGPLMKCSKCGHENHTGAKFCEECAAPLARVCANCGAQLSPTAKFCSECAHPAGEAAPPTRPRFGTPEAYTPKHLAEII